MIIVSSFDKDKYIKDSGVAVVNDIGSIKKVTCGSYYDLCTLTFHDELGVSCGSTMKGSAVRVYSYSDLRIKNEDNIDISNIDIKAFITTKDCEYVCTDPRVVWMKIYAFWIFQNCFEITDVEMNDRLKEIPDREKAERLLVDNGFRIYPNPLEDEMDLGEYYDDGSQLKTFTFKG